MPRRCRYVVGRAPLGVAVDQAASAPTNRRRPASVMFAVTDCGSDRPEPAAVLGDVGDAVAMAVARRRRSRRRRAAAGSSPVVGRRRCRTAPRRPRCDRSRRARRSRAPRRARTSKVTSWKAPWRPRPSTLSATSPGSWPRPVEEVGELAPDHVPDQRGLGHVRGRPGRDVLAVAEHGDPIAELEHLVEPVADEQDRHARRRPAGGPGGTGAAPRAPTAPRSARP